MKSWPGGFSSGVDGGFWTSVSAWDAWRSTWSPAGERWLPLAVLAFIEVKTRFSDAFGSPLEAVTAAKQREISRVAGAWIDRHGKPGEGYRLDVIGVTMRPSGPPRIEHVADAFRPGWR